MILFNVILAVQTQPALVAVVLVDLAERFIAPGLARMVEQGGLCAHVLMYARTPCTGTAGYS